MNCVDYGLSMCGLCKNRKIVPPMYRRCLIESFVDYINTYDIDDESVYNKIIFSLLHMSNHYHMIYIEKAVELQANDKLLHQFNISRLLK